MPSNIDILNQLAGQVGVDNFDDLLNDDFIGNTLAQHSNLPKNIGTIVAADSLTTDRVTGVAKVGDRSGSMQGDEIEEAFVMGWNGIDTVLAQTSQRGEFFLHGVLYNTNIIGDPLVQELYTYSRLVSATDNKTLNIAPLTRKQYSPTGATPTGTALQRTAADMALFQAACAGDDVDADFNPCVALMSDGFMNTGANAVAWRKFIQNPQRREKWQVFAVCLAEKLIVDGFLLDFQRGKFWTQFQDWMTRLSGEDSDEKAAARLLFETSMTGWGYFVDSTAKIDTIKNDDYRLRAQLYQQGEQYILRNLDSGYIGHGGLSIPATNVLTAWHEPEEILHVLQVKLSSSLVRASQVLRGQNAPVSNAALPDPDDSVV